MEQDESVGRMAVGNGWGRSAAAAVADRGDVADVGWSGYATRARTACRGPAACALRTEGPGAAACARRATGLQDGAQRTPGCRWGSPSDWCADRRQLGFTATELLIVVAVAGVLMTLAVPGFAALARSVGLSSAANELLSALHMARSSAVLRGVPVAVCLTADDRTCVAMPDSAATGWLVFVPDGSAAASRRAVVGEVLSRFHLPDRLTVSASRPTVTFWPVTRAAATSTFDLCDFAGAGRSIVVSQTGRPRVAAEATACA